MNLNSADYLQEDIDPHLSLQPSNYKHKPHQTKAKKAYENKTHDVGKPFERQIKLLVKCPFNQVHTNNWHDAMRHRVECGDKRGYSNFNCIGSPHLTSVLFKEFMPQGQILARVAMFIIKSHYQYMEGFFENYAFEQEQLTKQSQIKEDELPMKHITIFHEILKQSKIMFFKFHLFLEDSIEKDEFLKEQKHFLNIITSKQGFTDYLQSCHYCNLKFQTTTQFSHYKTCPKRTSKFEKSIKTMNVQSNMKQKAISSKPEEVTDNKKRKRMVQEQKRMKEKVEKERLNYQSEGQPPTDNLDEYTPDYTLFNPVLKYNQQYEDRQDFVIDNAGIGHLKLNFEILYQKTGCKKQNIKKANEEKCSKFELFKDKTNQSLLVDDMYFVQQKLRFKSKDDASKVSQMQFSILVDTDIVPPAQEGLSAQRIIIMHKYLIIDSSEELNNYIDAVVLLIPEHILNSTQDQQLSMRNNMSYKKSTFLKVPINVYFIASNQPLLQNWMKPHFTTETNRIYLYNKLLVFVDSSKQPLSTISNSLKSLFIEEEWSAPENKMIQYDTDIMNEHTTSEEAHNHYYNDSQQLDYDLTPVRLEDLKDRTIFQEEKPNQMNIVSFNQDHDQEGLDLDELFKTQDNENLKKFYNNNSQDINKYKIEEKNKSKYESKIRYKYEY